MFRYSSLLMALFLSIFLISAPVAANAGTGAPPQSPQGLKNSKKAMQSLRERQQQVRERKKQAYAKKKQAHEAKQSQAAEKPASSSQAK